MRIFSGIQPTGSKHLGNYIGAIAQFVAGQDRGEALYCIVDLHALTVPTSRRSCGSSVYDLAALLLAAGLDPERCILFRQSDVPRAHRAVLALVLAHRARSSAADAPVPRQVARPARAGDCGAARLPGAAGRRRARLPCARGARRRGPARASGADARCCAAVQRALRRWEEVLVVPEHRIPEVGARIMDLQDPTRKMSTTGGSPRARCTCSTSPRAIEKKIKSAVTDSGTEIRRAPEKPGISNLIEILAVARALTPEAIEAELASARGYGDLKAAAAAAVIDSSRLCVSATRICAPTRPHSRRCWPRAPPVRARSPPLRLPTCASAWAWGRAHGVAILRDRYGGSMSSERASAIDGCRRLDSVGRPDRTGARA